MRKPAVIGLLLAAILVALVPLAYASPPDPTWIAGVWDDGDYDDVVILATSSSIVTDGHVADDSLWVPLILAVVHLEDDTLSFAAAPCWRRPRAPPTTA
jgi:hypothetical protein